MKQIRWLSGDENRPSPRISALTIQAVFARKMVIESRYSGRKGFQVAPDDEYLDVLGWLV
jgi:hypothetical protein